VSLREREDCFQVYDCTFRFHTNNVTAWLLFTGLYRQFRNTGTRKADVVASIEESDSGIFRWQVAEKAGEASELAAALSGLESALCETIIRSQWRFIAVHAAALFSGGSLALLSGPSGAGKSTAAMALAHRGFEIGADDVVVVDPETLKVCPIPRCFHLDRQSISLLESDGFRLPASPVGRSFLTPGDFAMKPVEPSVARVLIFVLGRRQARPQLTVVSQAEMAGRLFQETGQGPASTRETIRVLAKLAAGASCYTLAPGPLTSTADAIAELIARHRRSPESSEIPAMPALS
jgi:hypothetical protein